MMRWLTIFALAVVGTCQAQHKVNVEQKKEIRILELLPYVVHPPLVDPCLPQHFTLGQNQDDPYFTQGYYWGYQKNIDEYFEGETTLSGCLIRAQISTTVSQLGLDRFSCDRNPNELAAAGFTEIKMNKGKWGIFPYRELQAKGPKGRKYYQLWVGLNAEGGATIYFQFIYPTFLNEPTQNQKKVWEDFVRKTDLLNIEDLMIAHGAKMNQGYTETEGEHEAIRFAVEKRKHDQKLFVRIEPMTEKKVSVEVQSIKDLNFLTEGIYTKPYVEIDSIVCENECQEIEKVRVYYSLVDEFSFQTDLLSLSRFEARENALIFQ